MDAIEPQLQARVLSVEWLPAGTRIERWEVVGRLGAGGYGTAYAVRRVGRPRGRLYALKLARQPGGKWFAREAAVLERVRHRGVVRMVTHGEWPLGPVDYPYLVLEYVQGESLYDWALARNPTGRQVALLLAQVAEALVAAHRKGALHRDFKGDNVLVQPCGQVKVLDWGAGWHKGAETLTSTARLPPGTPRYYSPQLASWRMKNQRRRETGRYVYTVADELYAVGVTFYRLMMDEYPPFQWSPERQLPEVLSSRTLLEPNPRIPEALASIVIRLLAFQPEARPASAAALAGEVRRLLAAADAAWDVPLFDWRTRASTHSRTTQDNAAEPGPVAPGQEVALRHARAQHLERARRFRLAQMLRQRHPARVAAAEARAIAATLVARRWLGVRRWLMGGAALAALGLAVAGLAWGLARVPPPDSSSGGDTVARGRQQVATPSLSYQAPPPIAALVPPPPSQEMTHMPTLEQKSGPSVTAQGLAPGALTTVKRCVVAAGAAATVACAGQQIRPDPSPCPPEALIAMREFGLDYEGPGGGMYLDVNQPGRSAQIATVRDGPIVGLTTDDFRGLPKGTLIYGRLWTGGEKVIARYTRVKLPDERSYPVCFTLGNEDGWSKAPGSKPGAVLLPRTVGFRVVKSFP